MLVINETVDMEESIKASWLITGSAAVIVSLLWVLTVVVGVLLMGLLVVIVLLSGRVIIMGVIVSIFAIIIVITSQVAVAVSSTVVVPAACTGVAWIVCILKTLSPSVASAWMSRTWIC